MNFNLSKIYFSILLVFVLFSCEEAEDSASSNNDKNQNTSTLDGDLSGASLNLMDDLFYDFNSNLDYTYNYYSVAGIGSNNTIEYPCLISERDSFDFYTFPEYLIEAKNCSDPSIICEESDNYENYLGNSLLDETYSGQCSCSCVDEGGDSIDCISNDAVGRSYNLVPTSSGACQDNTFSSDSTDCVTNGWIWFAENIDCALMDVNQDCVMDEEQELDLTNTQVLEVSINYNNLTSFVWDPDFERYVNVVVPGDKLFNVGECDCNLQSSCPDIGAPYCSSPTIENKEECEDEGFVWQEDPFSTNEFACEFIGSDWLSIGLTNDTLLVDDDDKYNTSNYWAVINEWEDINGMAYIDHNQWKDTLLVSYEQSSEGQEAANIIIDSTFTYTRILMGTDSLAFRKNTDCNNDGVWTEAEEYDDFGIDNCEDDQETGFVYEINYDTNYDGVINDDDLLGGEFTVEANNSYSCGTCQLNTVNVTNPVYIIFIDGVFTFTDNAVCDYDPNNDNWEEGYNILEYDEGNNKYDEGEVFVDRLDNLLVAEIFYDINDDGIRGAGEPWADLNCNGLYDGAENENSGNGIWDDDEIYQNSNINPNWDEGEPLYAMSLSPNQIIVDYDTNDDGVVDELDGEPLVITETYAPDKCLKYFDSPIYDDGPLCDANNNQIPNELVDTPGNLTEKADYADYNNNGTFDHLAAENLIMVYLNGDYVAVNTENLSLGGIIKEEEYEDHHYTSYQPIDEIKTIYYNEVIEDIPSDLITDDYFVTKTYWDTYGIGGTDGDGDGLVDRYYDYDYHLFRYTDSSDELGAGHLAKLVHPAYFYHYGYFYTPEEIESGFYEIADFKQDVMVYTADGLIREGESVTSFEEVVVDANNDGVTDMQYDVSKEFSVEYEEVSVPLKKVLGNIIIEGEVGNECSEGLMIACSDGVSSCPDAGGSEYGEDSCGERIKSLSDCSADTIINAFKIINTKNITMIGNGVEFGERNTIWLAQGIGIIADKLEHRWTESTETYDWKEYSRLELKSQSESNQGTNLLRNLFGGYKVIHFDDFENEAPFNGDAFNNIKPTGIIQRSKTTYE